MFIENLNIICENQKIENHFSIENTLVICGAGISFKSGLPSGYKIIKTINDLISNNTYQKKVNIFNLFSEYNQKIISEIINCKTSLYSYPRLEAIFNSIRSTLSKDDYYEFIKYVLYKDCANQPISSTDIHFELAEFIGNGGKVLTANFDQLIEEALDECSYKNYEKIVFPNNELVYKENVGMLIKYHGDINIPDSIGIDLSRLTINGFDNVTSKFLDKVFDEAKNILFIGFSVSDTLDLTPYLNTISECNYYYLNYRNRPNSLQVEHWKNTYINGEELEPFNFFCKKNNKNGYHIFESYEEDLIFKKYESKKAQILLKSTDLRTKEIQTLISNSDFSNKIYLSVLTNFGLLNLLSTDDKKSLADNEDALSYLNNINGSYSDELSKIKSIEGRTRFKNPKYLIKIQEYIFLSREMYLKRFLKTPYLLYSAILIKISTYYLKDEANNLYKSYSLNLLSLRIFQTLVTLKFPKWLIPTFIINRHIKQMNIQLTTCKKQNNLKLYRFSLKEIWYVNCYFKNKLGIQDDQLVDDLQELVELNADSNYLLDINNLLRNATKFINRNIWFDLSEKSCDIIGDELNLEKLRNAS